ncbi:MAG: hypothetical protein JXR07_05040 [Reichenbachiella sp.]
MIKKILPALALMILVAFSAQAQKVKKTQAYDAEKHAFHVHQHVMVTMKDGREKEAVIHGHISKKKYYVREYHSRRQGEVHEKYLRALTEGEIEALHAKKKAKKK